MTDAQKGLVAWLVTIAVSLAAGLGIGWKIWGPKPAPQETYAPEIRQKDGSVVLERKPMAPEDAAKVVPTPQLPKGAKVERRVEVVVQPSPPAPSSPSASGASAGDEQASRPGTRDSAASIEPARPCPPVRVDLALVRMPDQTRRVVASSPDGQVIGGVDIPEAPGPEPRRLKWTASLVRSWEPSTSRQSWGGMVQRDFGPVAVGLGGWNGAAFASVGVRF